jgi:hypothetical protein
LRRINARETVSEEHGKFVNGVGKYVKNQGVEGKLLNIPTIVTGLNEDGTIIQQEIEPYAYEVIDQNKRVID